MRLIERMRQQLSEAKAQGQIPLHWEVTPEAIEQIKDQASPGELSGTDYAGLWTLDGLGLKESTLPKERLALLISRRI